MFASIVLEGRVKVSLLWDTLIVSIVISRLEGIHQFFMNSPKCAPSFISTLEFTSEILRDSVKVISGWYESEMQKYSHCHYGNTRTDTKIMDKKGVQCLNCNFHVNYRMYSLKMNESIQFEASLVYLEFLCVNIVDLILITIENSIKWVSL